jgi:hypothetical protein
MTKLETLKPRINREHLISIIEGNGIDNIEELTNEELVEIYWDEHSYCEQWDYESYYYHQVDLLDLEYDKIISKINANNEEVANYN